MRAARTFGALLVLAVGAPAAVASYRHARTVVERSGDLAMAPWLPLTTDGMLLAALVVIWVRRLSGQAIGRGPWAAFWTGMAATVAANLAAAPPTVEGYVVALWPPICLAITLELVALVTTTPQATRGPEVPPVVVDPVAPPTVVEPAPLSEADPMARARELVAAGAGRPRLVKELGITDHRAKALIDELRETA